MKNGRLCCCTILILINQRFKKKINGTGDPVYSIVGYATYYPFYCHPDQVRMRIRYVTII